VSQTTDQPHQEQSTPTSTTEGTQPTTAGESTDTESDLPGNQPIQKSDPERSIRYMYDTACEDDEECEEHQSGFFKHYVNNTEEIDLLREYNRYEAERACRRHRISYVNSRVKELKAEKEADQ